MTDPRPVGESAEVRHEAQYRDLFAQLRLDGALVAYLNEEGLLTPLPLTREDLEKCLDLPASERELWQGLGTKYIVVFDERP